jgi:photosystem II stability/assembly factor-like uncharacterized protein
MSIFFVVLLGIFELNLGWKNIERFQRYKYLQMSKFYNPQAFYYIGPYGGMSFKPISSHFNKSKVVLKTLFDIHKCENIFADTFEIVIPYGAEFTGFPLGDGVMTAQDRFVIKAYDTLYYFTQNNFLSVDSVYTFGKINFIDSKRDTVYMIIGDSLFKSVDGGENFYFVYDLENILSERMYSYLMDISPLSANKIAITAFSDTVDTLYFLYSLDGGFSFGMNKIDTLPAFSLRIAHFDDDYVLITGSGGILKTQDFGSTWERIIVYPSVGMPVMPAAILDVVPLHPDTFLISSLLDRGVFKAFFINFPPPGYWFSSVVDTTFAPMFFEPIYINGSLSDTFYLGSNDGVFYTLDRGNSWIQFKERLKGIIIVGPGAFSAKKDTAFIITAGGIPYRNYDFISGFEELNFEGALAFWGSNLIENYRDISDNLYIVTPYLRLLEGYKTLWFSGDGGNSFINQDTTSSLPGFYDMFFGNNSNTLYLWNSDSIIKTEDGGNSYLVIYKDTSDIEVVQGEGDTLFVLSPDDSLFVSYDGGMSFYFLKVLPGSEIIFWLKGSYVFYSDTLENLLYYDLNSDIIDTTFKFQNKDFIFAFPSEDGFIYALYFDLSTSVYEIYYSPVPKGNVTTEQIPIQERFIGFFPGTEGKILLYSMGRGFYYMDVVGIGENKRVYKNKVFIYGNFVKDRIEFFVPLRSKLNLYIFDITGRKVLYKSIKSDRRAHLNLKFLPSGTYYLKVNKDKLYKIIKIK